MHQETATRGRFQEIITIKPSFNMRFEPDLWNAPDLVKNTNCYAYALNNPRVGMGQLGGLESKIPNWLDFRTLEDVWFVQGKAMKDGLVPLPEGNLDPARQHIIGVFTGWRVEWGEVALDYHFIRKDADGSWSDKPGPNPARTIVVPTGVRESEVLLKRYLAGEDDVSRKERAHFIGFFAVPEHGVRALVDPKVILGSKYDSRFRGE